MINETEYIEGRKILDGLSVNQLFRILECNDLSSASTFFRIKFSRSGQNKINVLTPLLENYAARFSTVSSHLIFPRSFVAALMEAPSYPLIILWCLVGIAVGFTYHMMTILCLAFGGLIITDLYTFMIGKYCELKKEDREMKNTIRLLGLHQLSIDSLLAKLGKSPDQIKNMKRRYSADARMSNKATLEEEAEQDEQNYIRYKNALEVVLIVSATLCSAYYVTLQSVLMVLGYTELGLAIAGPAGIGAALAVSFGVAVLLGICKYKFDLLDEQISDQIDSLHNEVSYYLSECKSIRSRLHHQLRPLVVNQDHYFDQSGLTPNQGSSPSLSYPRDDSVNGRRRHHGK